MSGLKIAVLWIQVISRIILTPADTYFQPIVHPMLSIHFLMTSQSHHTTIENRGQSGRIDSH